MTNIQEIQTQIKTELGKKEVLNALVATTFKGLTTPNIYLAVQEGMLRGFKFEDFLQRNIYAIAFNNNRTGQQEYSLITSSDYTRKVGMRSGVVGKSKPEFEEKDGQIVSCTITIKRKVGDYIGDYSDTVFFKEYSTGRNLWTSKPRTMIAKVAEMHALRMACPEELSKVYVEEEFEQEREEKVIDITEYKTKLENAKNEVEKKKLWLDFPAEVKLALKEAKQKENEDTKVSK